MPKGRVRDGVQYVYFAQAAPGAPVKIGTSRNPTRRMKSLRCPKTGLRPLVLNTVLGGLHVESWYHQRHIDWLIGGRGEWFALPEDVVEELKSMTSERSEELQMEHFRSMFGPDFQRPQLATR